MQPHRNWMIHLFTALAMLLVATKASAADRPNILLIVSDDQGYNDLGQLGNGIITPALDRLANEGTRLTNFYVAWPACTPSRASLLTGRYPQRNGIYDMIRNEAPDYGLEYKPDDYDVLFQMKHSH
ncbi:MAG: sulfatase [Rhodopirellula sp. JB055]|uniref:sulfatase family protein n=1 Tax=Rhodopirellula sp. JB055 TaxID=3342846 RepID=UPI00370A9E17